MKRFFQSFFPLKSALTKKLKKYKIEIFLLIVAFSCALISATIFFLSQNEPEVTFEEKTTISYPSKILVDIAGAVEKPDVYEVSAGARLKDVLIMAGGLSPEADRQFFRRYFNLARILTDQEKIYIPSISEVQAGIFIEKQQTLENPSQKQSEKININKATSEELEQLPGIGKITAQKIIEGRPYQSIDQLLTKKVVRKSVYEKIVNMITAD